MLTVPKIAAVIILFCNSFTTANSSVNSFHFSVNTGRRVGFVPVLKSPADPKSVKSQAELLTNTAAVEPGKYDDTA
jgi:hypothetical protein